MYVTKKLSTFKEIHEFVSTLFNDLNRIETKSYKLNYYVTSVNYILTLRDFYRVVSFAHQWILRNFRAEASIIRAP